MNKEQEHELFNQIEEVLQTHEETYELGAWEEFDANRKKKRGWPFFAWTAAAIVLLCLGFGLFEMAKTNDAPNDNVLVKKNDKQREEVFPSESGDESRPSHQKIRNNPNIATRSSALSLVVEKNTLNIKIQGRPNETIAQDYQPEAIPERRASETSIAGTATATVIADKPMAQKTDKIRQVLPGAYDSLTNRNAAMPAIEKNESKITYSLVVSPSLSNQKVNFGAGMELSYKMTTHFSLSGGLMYTALNAKSDGKSFMSTNGKTQSANLALSGVELPLGIQYQTKAGFYASAGVSALGLINDKLEYDFLEERTVTVSNTSAGAGLTNDVYKVVSERKTEESIEPLNNYMGFFNFSAGKKQAIGNLKLNIGPFVKVPFSSVSSEKIKLLQGGVKVSIDF